MLDQLVHPSKKKNTDRCIENSIVIFSGLAAIALVNTYVAAAAGLITWVVIDAIRGHVSISGACVGPVVGLVAITPACGYVQPGWAILIGVLPTGIIYGLLLLKKYMRFDDTLDVAVVHGVGMFKFFFFIIVHCIKIILY
jgi:Amt family ammonium transporter